MFCRIISKRCVDDAYDMQFGGERERLYKQCVWHCERSQATTIYNCSCRCMGNKKARRKKNKHENKRKFVTMQHVVTGSINLKEMNSAIRW